MSANEALSQNLKQQKESILEAVEKKEKPKKAAQRRNVNDYLNFLKFYFLPLVIVIIFFSVLVIGVIPSLKGTIEGISNISGLNDEIEIMNTRLVDLQTLQNSSTKTELYLENIQRIAPVEITQVANFQNQVIKLGETNGLKTLSAKARESIVASADTDEQASTDVLQLIEIPTEYNFTGSFSNIKSFLTQIYLSNDFIIIEEMDFSREGGQEDWNLQIVLTKYQFNETSDETDLMSTYISVPEKAVPNKQVIDFLDKKYIQDQTTETNQ